MIKPGNIYCGDNLPLMKEMPSESIDLIYCDPPFNTNRDFNQFKDKFNLSDIANHLIAELKERRPPLFKLIDAIGGINGENDKAYLIYMAMRLLELYRVLKDTGSIYLHCDQTMSHSLKLIMDAVFGKKNFKREIVWQMKSVSGFKSKAKNWIRDNDIILFYVKDRRDFIFNKELAPYKKEYIEKLFRNTDKDGRRYRQRRSRRRYYEDQDGVPIGSVWSDIYSMQTRTRSNKKTVYPTQKPLELLKRIIKASCPEDGVVLDPFCGSGTTLLVAKLLKRKWIGIDTNPEACKISKERVLGWEK